MANWANVRLTVIGSRKAVREFREHASKDPRYFTAEMRQGEGGSLGWDRPRRSSLAGLWEQTYDFQVAHDDESVHFRRLSRRHPGCWFALAFSDPNADATGGHLIKRGGCESFGMSSYAKLRYRLRAGYDEGSDTDSNEVLFWEAEWRMLDACMAFARGRVAPSTARAGLDSEFDPRRDFPSALIPDGRERIRLGRQTVRIPKTSMCLERWRGKRVRDRYGGKPVARVNGRPAFAELAIVKLLQAAGWGAAWIDTYRRRYVSGYCDTLRPVRLPASVRERLERIYSRATSRSGAFDVVAWNGDDILFVEAKRKGRDRVRETQRRWVTAAFREGLSPAEFLIAEWEYEGARGASGRRRRAPGHV